jgi:hypothetical protein
MGIDNRKHPRRKIGAPARIGMVDGSTAAAGVLDISQGGARLKVRQPGILPEQFLLNLGGKLERWSRIAWRSDKEIGVEFLATPQEAADPAAKRAVFIKCPRTGKTIRTGIQLTVPSDLDRISNTRRFTQCPVCKVVHSWLPSEASLDEVSIS